jgi:HD-like signal output (HDOD) protein
MPSLSLNTLKNIQPVPRACHEILAMSDDDRASAADYAAVIASDPRMTLQVLRVANSALLARRTPATSVKDAIVTVGLAETTRIAIACALLGELTQPHEVLDFNDVLTHGLSVADRWSAHGTATATSGVLVDAALLAMALDVREFTSYASRIHDTTGPEELHAVERELFGLDRCELGALLSDVWELPSPIGDVLGGWHVCRTSDSSLYDEFGEVTRTVAQPLLRAFATR